MGKSESEVFSFGSSMSLHVFTYVRRLIFVMMYKPTCIFYIYIYICIYIYVIYIYICYIYICYIYMLHIYIYVIYIYVYVEYVEVHDLRMALHWIPEMYISTSISYIHFSLAVVTCWEIRCDINISSLNGFLWKWNNPKKMLVWYSLTRKAMIHRWIWAWFSEKPKWRKIFAQSNWTWNVRRGS